MLYFSKTRIIFIYSIIIFLTIFSFSNFIGDKNSSILNKKINLGLDLQGGSYLLLEVNSSPVINQRLQQKLLNLRKELKKNNFEYKDLRLTDESIEFFLKKDDIEKFKEFFLNKNNSLNIYYDQFRSYEMDYLINQTKIQLKQH